MKYGDYYYARIKVQDKKELMDSWLKRFAEARSAREQISVIEEVDKMSGGYQSYSAIANLNFSRNINDSLAKKEKDYYDIIAPEMKEIFNRLEKLISASKFKKKYF